MRSRRDGFALGARGHAVARAGIGLLALLGWMVLARPSHASADSSPPAKVVSIFESYWGATMPRDCGFSRVFPSRPGFSVWFFCDTPVVDWTGKLTGFITGSTAALGPYTAGLVPSNLSELPSPPASLPAMPHQNGPSRFLTMPGGLVTTSGQPCGSAGTGSYAASWLTGVTREPGATTFLISYNDVCVMSSTSFVLEGMGLARYDPARNVVEAQQRVFFSYLFPKHYALGSPVFHGGYLYLYSSTCASSAFGVCTSGAIYVARVPATPAAWINPSSYTWWNGTGWAPSYTSAVSVLQGATPIGVTVDSFPGRPFVMIQQNDIGGRFTVYTASQPTGPWTKGRTDKVPCVGGTGLDLCRALIGHPELSTASSLLLSYYDPGASHVMVASFPW